MIYGDVVVREKKGKSIIDFPDNYTIIDIETTGLSTEYDSIIELAAIKVRNNKIEDTFSTLVKPFKGIELDQFIIQLTGINQNMIDEAPDINEVLKNYVGFIGDDIIIGHNVNFDINFIYDEICRDLGQYLENDYIDTLRISRKLFKSEKHHRLMDVSERLNVKYEGAHRAVNDCFITKEVYDGMKSLIEENIGIESFKILFNKSKQYHHYTKYEHLSSDEIISDEDNKLYGKTCVITGTLKKYSRNEALAAIERIGGIVSNSVTKKTNYLILGNNDYCSAIKDGKSSKQKKAENYKLQGQDIEIITEATFYEMLDGD